MALSSKDGLWDRNFESFEQNELNRDSALDDKISIVWTHPSLLKQKRATLLVIGNDKASHLFDALLRDSYFKIASIKYANQKVNVVTSQRGIAQEVLVFSNKNPAKSAKITMQELGPGASILASAGKLQDEESKKEEIIFVRAGNVHRTYNHCISEFIMFHFRPQQVLCFDVMQRGRFVQNYDEMEMPQIRKLFTSTMAESVRNDDEKEAENEEVQRVNASTIQYLETANLVHGTLSAAVLQQCEYNGINGAMFVSISDLDYLAETLISFGSILLEFCPDLGGIVDGKQGKELKAMVTRKCAKFGNKGGHLSTGRNMFC